MFWQQIVMVTIIINYVYMKIEFTQFFASVSNYPNIIVIDWASVADDANAMIKLPIFGKWLVVFQIPLFTFRI